MFLNVMHMLSNNFVAILGFIAMAVGILSFVSTKQNNTRTILGISAGFWSIHYYLLAAYTTAGIQLVLVFRNIISVFVKSEKGKHIVFWIAVALITGLSLMTWHGWKSIVPLAAGLNSTYALCYLDNKKMRQMMVVTSILWLINGIIWLSVAQIAAEMIKIGINLFVSKKVTGDVTAENDSQVIDVKNLVKKEVNINRPIVMLR